MNKNIYLGLLFSAMAFLSCNDSPKVSATYKSFKGEAQSTSYSIIVDTQDSTDKIISIIDSVFNVINNSMSIYNDNSLVSKINQNITDSTDEHIRACFDAAKLISIQTNGMYDVTVRPLVAAYGFANQDEKAKNVNIDSLLQFIGYEKISCYGDKIIKENSFVQLDFNSIAKGYTSDLIARCLDSLGVKNYLVEIGGEIFCRGVNSKGKEWIVGIDRPEEGNMTPGKELQTKISLSGKGLATSGNYRKYYTNENGEKIVHTINPKTGKPAVSNLLSVTVIAENTMLADGYSTAFMSMGLDKTLDFLAVNPDIDAYIIYADENGNYQIYATPGANELISE